VQAACLGPQLIRQDVGQNRGAVDRAEARAFDWLTGRFPNADLVHEPDGNIAPDFLLDGRIAIEVRRLGEHAPGLNPTPLIQTGIPFQRRLRSIAATVPRHEDRTLLMWVGYSRPLPSVRELEAGVGPFLERLAVVPEPAGMSRLVTPTVELKCLDVRRSASRQFTFAWIDHNGWGTPIDVLRRNLGLCILDKLNKTAWVRNRYPVWWLLLVNELPFGADECERLDDHEWSALAAGWDDVIVIDWTDDYPAFELTRSVQQADSADGVS
jgi:hypothetical protein